MRKRILAFLLITFIYLTGCSQTSNTNDPAKIEITKDQDQTYFVSDEAKAFKNKNELTDAILDDGSEHDVTSLSFFFEPKWIPKDANLGLVNVREVYCGLTYYIGEEESNINDPDASLIFCWHRDADSSYPKEYMDKNKRKYTHLKGKTDFYMYTVENPSINSEGLVDLDLPLTPTCKQIFWTQDGFVFSAAVPLTISDDEIEKFCDAKMVKVKDK